MPWKKQLEVSLEDWKDTINGIEKLHHEVASVNKLLEDLHSPNTVMIFGEFNAGKSTFINAYLGEKILTSDIIPTTAVMTKLVYGQEKKLIGYFPDGTSRVFQDNWLEGLSAEREGVEKDIRRQLSYLEMQLPNEKLKNLTIIDTPGLNSGNPLHTQATEAFMDRADFAIWLFNYREVGTKSQLKGLHQLKSLGLEPIGVVNAIDQHDEDEEPLESFIEDRLNSLHGQVSALYPVSALEALEGIVEGDAQKLEWSNWKEIEELFSEIERDGEQKKARIFTKLTTHLREVERFFQQGKMGIPVPFYAYKVDHFINHQYPAIQELHSRTVVEQSVISDNNRRIEKIYQTPISNLETIHKEIKEILTEEHLHRVEKINDLMFGWNSKGSLVYKEYLERQESFNHQVLDHREVRGELLESWEEIRLTKYFKKRKLKKFEKSMESFNIANERIHARRKELLLARKEVNSKLHTFYGNLQEIALYIYEDGVHKAKISEKTWDREYSSIRQDLLKINFDYLDKIDELQKILIEFKRTIGSFVKQPFAELDLIQSYQESVYVAELIEGSIPSIPMDTFFLCYQDLNKMGTMEVVHKIEASNLKFDMPTIQEGDIPTVPPPVAVRVAEAIAEINSKNKLRLGIASAILIIGFSVSQVDFASGSEEESEVEEEYAAETTMEEFADEETYEETDFSTWDETSLAGFLDTLYESVREGRITSVLSEEAWTSFSPIYDGVSHYEQRFVDHILIEQKDLANLQFQTEETFIVDGEMKKVRNFYNLHNSEFGEPIVSSFNSEEVEMEIMVDESQLSQFLANYRSSYMEALNMGDFSLIEPYLTPGGLAMEDLRKYVAEVTNQGFYFEFQSFQVTSLQRTGPQSYLVNTEEQFTFTDNNNGEKTQYVKEKQYAIALLSEGSFTIDSIETLSTEKEAVEINTVSLVNEEQVRSFMDQYYKDFVLAFNELGFSYVEHYYNPDGQEYDDAKSYLDRAIEKGMRMENLYNEVQSITAINDQHYQVQLYFEDTYYYQDGTGDSKKVTSEFLLKVSPDGELFIEDIPTLEILEETEF